MALREPNNATEKLFEAIQENDIDKFKWALRQADIDVNYKQQETGFTPLHLCLGKSSFVNELMKHNPRHDIFDKDGFTALHIAAKYGFSEVMFLLVSRGADVNAKQDDKSSTPLELALEDDFTTTCREYLLFLGAALTEKAQAKLDRETLERQETVLQGFGAGKIIFEGKTLPVQTTTDFEELDMAVENLSYVPIDFFCRRIEPEYQEYETFTPKIPLSSKQRSLKGKFEIMDNDELKSDIFQFKIDLSGKFNLEVPIYDKVSGHDFARDAQYAELVIKISHKTPGADTVKEITGAEYSNGKAVIKNVELGLQGQSPLVSLGVFLRNKIDQKSLDANRRDTITSKAESKFKISTTENTFNEKTDVALQVVKTKETPEEREQAKEVVGYTNFCSALSAEKPAEDCITIELPKPILVGVSLPNSSTLVLTCRQDDNGEKEENWTPVEKNITETEQGVKLPQAAFGHYIVLAVRFLGKGIRRLRKLVSNLYSSSTGKKVWCSLLAMTQKLNESANRKFLIISILCRFDEKDEIIKKKKEEGFAIQATGISKVFNVNPEKTYFLTFELFDAKLMTKIEQLPLKYQENHLNFQIVQTELTGKRESGSGNVCLLKKRLTKAQIRDAVLRESLVVFIPVNFNVGDLSERPGEFFNDRLLGKIAEQLGKDWFEVMVYLGMRVMELKGLDMVNRMECNLFMLKRWRERHANDPDRGLRDFLSAVTSVSRQDIRKLVEHYLNEFLMSSSMPVAHGYDTVDSANQNTLIQWLDNKNYIVRGETLKIKLKPLLENMVMSPFEDRFLFFVSSKIVGDDIIPKCLGLKDAKFQDMKHIDPPSRRMCEMLAVLKAGESEDPPCSFIRKLINEIKDTKNNLAVMETEQKIKDWLANDDQEFSRAEKEKIRRRLNLQ